MTTKKKVKGRLPGAVLGGLGEKVSKLNARGAGVLEKVRDLREIVKEIEGELEYFRQKEPILLDSIRSQILHQFATDPDRRWTTTDYGILLDKQRLLTGQSQINLHSLLSVVDLAEAAELKRLGGGGK